jgi:hypothetical protein
MTTQMTTLLAATLALSTAGLRTARNPGRSPPGIAHRFEGIFTSEECGCAKPAPAKATPGAPATFRWPSALGSGA